MVLFLAEKRGQWGRKIGEGIITGNGDEREMQAAYCLGMHEGIDAPLCSGISQRMDPCTSLLYFPNQETFWGTLDKVALVF